MKYFLPLLLLLQIPHASAQTQAYGAKGIFPVYEMGGQWLIYDKSPDHSSRPELALSNLFLVVGDQGAGIFNVARSSNALGGFCLDKKPAVLHAALLKGPRSSVGKPIIGIHVPANFSLSGSHARYVPLKNQVAEAVYQRLGEALRQSAIEDVKSGAFHFKADDESASLYKDKLDPAKVQTNIAFAAGVPLAGLTDPLVLVVGTQIGGSFRRCIRLANAGKLIGACVEMPYDLMAETTLLRFIAYDPAGRGAPLLLAYTPTAPLWGHERWGFIVRADGIKPLLADAMDPSCRASF